MTKIRHSEDIKYWRRCEKLNLSYITNGDAETLGSILVN